MTYTLPHPTPDLFYHDNTRLRSREHTLTLVMKRSYAHERKQKSLAAGAKKIGFAWFFYISPHAYTKQKIGAAGVPVAPIDRGRPQMGRAAAIMVVANGY